MGIKWRQMGGYQSKYVFKTKGKKWHQGYDCCVLCCFGWNELSSQLTTKDNIMFIVTDVVLVHGERKTEKYNITEYWKRKGEEAQQWFFSVLL